MQQKIQIILFQLVAELKKLGWLAEKDWELTYQVERTVKLTKEISVEGSIGDAPAWTDSFLTSIAIKLESDDEITYFPEYVIETELFVPGGNIREIQYSTDNETAFSDRDITNPAKAMTSAKQIDVHVANHIQEAFDEYLLENGNAIDDSTKGTDPDAYDDPL